METPQQRYISKNYEKVLSQQRERYNNNETLKQKKREQMKTANKSRYDTDETYRLMVVERQRQYRLRKKGLVID